MKAISIRFLQSCVLFLLVLSGCSDDGGPGTDPQPIDGGEVFTSQLVAFSSSGITQDEYNATLGDVDITVAKVNDSTAAFLVPSDITIGDVELSVEGLDNLQILYDIKRTILSASPEEVVDGFVGIMDEYLDDVGAGEDGEIAQQVYDNFIDFYDDATAEEKTAMAEVYQANKTLFDDMVNEEYAIGRTTQIDLPKLKLTKCQRSISLLGLGAVGAYLTAPTAATGVGGVFFLGFSATVIFNFNKAKRCMIDMGDDVIKWIELEVDEVISSIGRSQASSIEFEDGVLYTETCFITGRALESGDLSDQTEGMSFFNVVYEAFNSLVTEINELITRANEFVFGSDVDQQEPLALPADQPEVKSELSEDGYSNLTFTVTDPNVSINNPSFSGGELSLTLTINDPEQVQGESVSTELRFSYNDEFFNNGSGSFPIEVYLSETAYTCDNSHLYVSMGHDILPGGQGFVITAIANRGVGPYDFYWSFNGETYYDESTFSSIVVPDANISWIGVEVTDALGCIVEGFWDICDNAPGCEMTGENTFTDPRDAQMYTTVQIGSQEWMAENLNYTTGNSWCYDDNSANCNTYGRLYDWQTALSACPTGWHLPTDAEWTVLTEFLGGKYVAGGIMKEAGLAHWNSPNEGATNSSGFSGLPGGLRVNNGYFYDLGHFGIWWSATELDADYAWYRTLDYNDADVYRYLYSKAFGLSCRCVRD